MTDLEKNTSITHKPSIENILQLMVFHKETLQIIEKV